MATRVSPEAGAMRPVCVKAIAPRAPTSISGQSYRLLLTMIAMLLIVSAAHAQGGGYNASVIDSESTRTVDLNEQTHLIFMREEEKLARDVYITLGTRYPQAKVFGYIDDSEQRHTCAVCDTLEKYGIDDPSTNDNVGVFTGEDYGWYFTEKYGEFVKRGSTSLLDALYVGAYIEELDMIDINQCPNIIVETDNGIDDVSECGKVYTDNADIQRLYGSLIEGSEHHLRAYVAKIEGIIGEGAYVAQVLTQEQVNAILER